MIKLVQLFFILFSQILSHFTVQLFQRACLRSRPTSTLLMPRGISVDISVMLARIPYPFNFQSTIVAYCFQFCELYPPDNSPVHHASIPYFEQITGDTYKTSSQHVFWQISALASCSALMCSPKSSLLLLCFHILKKK